MSGEELLGKFTALKIAHIGAHDLDMPGPGVYSGDFDDLALIFGTTPWRRQLITALAAWSVSELSSARESVEALVVAGSLVSSAAEPHDIDCTVVLDETTPGGQALALRLKRDRSRLIQSRLDVTVNSGVFLQYVGPKAAQRIGGEATALRGVVSIASWLRQTPRTQDLLTFAEWKQRRVTF